MLAPTRSPGHRGLTGGEGAAFHSNGESDGVLGRGATDRCCTSSDVSGTCVENVQKQGGHSGWGLGETEGLEVGREASAGGRKAEEASLPGFRRGAWVDRGAFTETGSPEEKDFCIWCVIKRSILDIFI